jgi:uncharacterized BrkB/YihY/UPF0761 family membrane protein
MWISSWEFDRSSVSAGVGVLAGGVAAGYLGWRVLPWPVLRRRLRDVWREDSEYPGVSRRERMVVFGLHAVLFFLLILIVGYLWATVIVIGVYSLWEWLAKRSRR